MIKLKDILSELEFSSQEEFNKYRAKHKISPDTEVKVGNYTTSAERHIDDPGGKKFDAEFEKGKKPKKAKQSKEEKAKEKERKKKEDAEKKEKEKWLKSLERKRGKIISQDDKLTDLIDFKDIFGIK